MAIYRGPGGSGDATGDSANQAQVAETFSIQAGVSAAAAAASATTASNAATAAGVAQTAAEDAQTAAETAETNAETAETNAETAQSAAEAAQLAAEEAQTAAELAETNAETAETNAETAETNAETAQTAAEAAQAAAEAAQTAAELAETNAETAETNAEAAQTAAEAAQSAAEIAQTAAELAETNAETAETGAVAAQLAAESARDSALAAYDNFDDRYLGSKTSDPTLDNDGDALVAGALYFNSVDGAMRVYTGSVWVDAYAAGTSFLAKANNLSDLPNVATARQNLDLEIGVDVQAYDATILKSADIGVTVQGYDATLLNDADIGVTVQAYDATIVVDADIGVTVQGYDADTVKYDDVNPSFTDTGAIKIPVGTELQRPGSPVAGQLRFNDDADEFEGYDGTAWGAIGGGGSGQMLGDAAVKAISYNAQTIAENLTVLSTYNALSVGPITIDSGYTVTVESGGRLVVI